MARYRAVCAVPLSYGAEYPLVPRALSRALSGKTGGADRGQSRTSDFYARLYGQCRADLRHRVCRASDGRRTNGTNPAPRFHSVGVPAVLGASRTAPPGAVSENSARAADRSVALPAPWSVCHCFFRIRCCHLYRTPALGGAALHGRVQGLRKCIQHRLFRLYI